jgi:hypothetical protein
MVMPAIDEGKLHQVVGQILNDLGGAASVAMVRMGDALGLYKTLHAKGSMTCEELALAAGGISDTCESGSRNRPHRNT